MAKNSVNWVKGEDNMPRMIREIAENVEKLDNHVYHVCLQNYEMEIIFDRAPERKEI